MKKVLLVSAYPYSRSSRGMDVLTQAFECEGWDVHHLTFPNVFYTPEIPPPSDTKTTMHYARKSWFPYIDRYMWRLPCFAYYIIRRLNTNTIRSVINLADFDVIVLESGKPLFLLHLIPPHVTVVYRQSDSVRLVLGKNPWYRKEEDDAFSQADLIILKKKLYTDFVPAALRHKTRVIENGMAVSEGTVNINPFSKDTLNAVYNGLHALDVSILCMLCDSYPEVNFHIIGPCLRPGGIKKLRRFNNFQHYPFLVKETYMPMLEFADLAIFPFTRNETMKWYGLTSKFLHFMLFKLPIVSCPTGFPGEFDGLPVRFAEGAEEFRDAVGLMLGQKPVEYPIDLKRYSAESRLDEYRKVVSELEPVQYGDSEKSK